MNSKSCIRLRVLAVLPLLAVFSAIAALAAAPRWTPLGPPDGASVAAVAFDPTNANVAYASVWGGGAFKSVDGGRTWFLSSAGLYAAFVNALAVDPLDPRAVYAGTTQGFYRSHDGGQNWLPSDLHRDVLAVAVDSQRAGSLNASTRNGLFRSTDGGVHWVETSRGLVRDVRFYAPAMVAAPSQPRTLYASYIGFRNGVFRSEDAGKTWLQVSRDEVSALAVDPADPDLVYAAGEPRRLLRSTDGGATWTRLPVVFERLATDPSRPGAVIGLDGGGGISISEDEGQSWRSLANLGREIQALAISPSQPSTWLAGTAGAGVMRSEDGGRTWQGTTGLAGFSATLVRIVPERNAIFTAGASSLYRTTNGGASWDRVFQLGPVSALAVDPSDPDTLYLGLDGGQGGGSATALVYKSEDGGDTWRPTSAGINRGPIADLIVLPAEPQTVFAAVWDGDVDPFTNLPGLFRSTDGGGSWSQVPRVFGVVDLELNPADLNVIYATHDRGILRSQDRGRTWQLRAVGGSRPGTWARRTRQIAAAPSDGNRLAVIDPYSTFLSSDEGRSWRNAHLWGPDLNRSVAFDPLDADTLYNGVTNGVYRSRDGGSTWSFFSRGLPGVVVNDLVFDPSDPTKLYAATSSAGVFVMNLRP
jgi:photosystem II stability/assembly factor-like uncharacterized protein